MAPTADEINAMLDAASARLSEEMPTLNGANPFAAETPPVTDEDIAAQQLALFEEAVKREVETLRIREAARREFARQQRDEAAFPELLTLEQRLALPREEIRHRIEGWFPVNARIILAAQFKAGKTTLVGNLVRSLADGRRFLGTAEVTPPEGTIVVLNFEDSPNASCSCRCAVRPVRSTSCRPMCGASGPSNCAPWSAASSASTPSARSWKRWVSTRTTRPASCCQR
jgi:hypothetical protein